MKIAAVFPGQGSQSPGMLADLAAEYSLIKQTFDEASAALDYDLWDIAQNGSEEQQRETAITQPLVFVGDIACLLYTSPSPRDRTRSRMPSSA